MGSLVRDDEPRNLTATGQDYNQQAGISLDQLEINKNSINDKTKHEEQGNNSVINRKKREVYKFTCDWLISSVAWSNNTGAPYKLAISSFIEDYKNQIQLVCLDKDEQDQELKGIATFDHPYPATKVLWIPRPEAFECYSSNNSMNYPTLLATTADYLRIWKVIENADVRETMQSVKLNMSNDSSNSTDSEQSACQVKLECLLNSNPGSKLCAPLTSFDWNDVDPKLIVTSSVDATCVIWDLEVQKELGEIYRTSSSSTSPQVSASVRTQVVAHDHHVFDVSFSRAGSGRDIFVSCSADNSVRLFDLRKLNTSSVLFENKRLDSSQTKELALVRVSCSKQNENLVSTFATKSNELIIIDLRNPGKPMCTLNNHQDNLNSMSWAPHSRNHMCTAADDCQALIWDLSNLPMPVEEPLLAYRADSKINTISWSTSNYDWIAIGYENCLELLRV